MTTTEKVAYMKGLMEGMQIDESTNEGKLFKLVNEILDDLSKDVADLQDYTAELTEQVDAVDEDLNTLEEDFYDDWDDEDECAGCPGCDGVEDDEDEEYYDVTCPSCGEEFEVDEDTLLDGGIDCPNCNEHLEFDFDCDEESDEQE